MFDDYEDEDLTDLLPDPEDEFQEEEQRRQQYQRGRRMTVSEVSVDTLFLLCYLKNYRFSTKIFHFHFRSSFFIYLSHLFNNLIIN